MNEIINADNIKLVTISKMNKILNTGLMSLDFLEQEQCDVVIIQQMSLFNPPTP
jgi:hypothetical protein